MWSLISLASVIISFTTAAPRKRALSPTVETEYATIVGSSQLGIDSFKGIPYAQPPVGNLRLKPPQPITSNLGIVMATGQPRQCPQILYSINKYSLPESVVTLLLDTPLVQTGTNAGEDCLTVNSKLPVVFWIYGGGFNSGSTQVYDASNFISTSVAQGKDVIYVSVNYRVGGFGFLAGPELRKDGSVNLGHLDQRLGMEWVADNIAAFGGDPSRVTMWGESAGSISVFNQMTLYGGNNTYKGKPLFRGAIMDSGSVVPTDPVDCPKAQSIFNQVVAAGGCSGSSDTLACLRGLDYTTFLKATQQCPLHWTTQLLRSRTSLVPTGSSCQTPLSTTAELEDYLSTLYFNDAAKEQVHQFVANYPDEPSAGSSYRTGVLNQLYPQYKRLAALLGDFAFTLTRRIFLNTSANVNPSVPSWSYLASYDYGIPFLGTFHASDILQAYGTTPDVPSFTIQSYYISFINTLDPNSGTTGLPNWPQWKENKQLAHFLALNNSLITDDFRSESYDFLMSSGASFRY